MSIQVFKRKDSRIIVNLSDLMRINATDAKSYEEQGYRILELAMDNGDSTYFRTRESDGLLRVIPDKWDITSVLYPYDSDQFKWSELVMWWFDNFKTSEQYTRLSKSYGNIISVDDAIEAGAKLMSSYTTGRSGKKGRRESELYRWFANSKNSFITNYVKNNTAR